MQLYIYLFIYQFLFNSQLDNLYGQQQYSLNKKKISLTSQLNKQDNQQSINRIDQHNKARMLQDHDNLLSTFGKDSQSSNYKQKQISQVVKNRRFCLNYQMQSKIRFDQIFHQRSTLMLPQKRVTVQKINKKQQNKKLKTETDIQDLNNKIRRSISGIAEIIGRSKNEVRQRKDYEGKLESGNISVVLPSSKTTAKSSSYKQMRGFESVSKLGGDKEKSRSSRYVQRQKQNLNYINSNTINTITTSSLNSNSRSINAIITNVKNTNSNSNNKTMGNNRSSFSSINNRDSMGNKKGGECLINKDRSLRNSTKKKTNYCYSFETIHSRYGDFSNSNNSYNNVVTNQNDSKIIKQSYSIDLNSQRYHDSISHHQHQQESSRINNNLNSVKFETNVINNSSSMKQQQLLCYQPRLSTKHRQSLSSRFNRKPHLSVGRDNEDTLKKEFKQQQYQGFDSDYIEQSKLLQSNNKQQNFNKSKPNMSTQKQGAKQQLVSCSSGHNNQFLFSSSDSNHPNSNFTNCLQQQEQGQYRQGEKSPDFNKIQVPKKFCLNDIKKRLIICEDKKRQHPLIAALMDQIELDFDLRHAKHMFSGIEQPFHNNQRYDNSAIFLTTSSQPSKWQLLNQELNNRGLYYNVQTIKKIFLPSQQQLDPFLSVTHPHDQLIYSLIYAYETAEIHWEQVVYKKWQHWDLRDIQLTIQNIDRERKGFITVEDIAAFVSMQAGKEYKNRDVILIYKRVINGFSTKAQSNNFQSNNFNNTEGKLKFRSLIDSLIKNF